MVKGHVLLEVAAGTKRAQAEHRFSTVVTRRTRAAVGFPSDRREVLRNDADPGATDRSAQRRRAPAYAEGKCPAALLAAMDDFCRTVRPRAIPNAVKALAAQAFRPWPMFRGIR
ncbi:hypothetical protein [Candidatus Accumulibacter phosphatis]|uniref:Uncharacterized protein n=1 Tax=Candidatus Accumulibacter phosphatis TaxID=327160 RepID=A0A5S4EJF4_9PROT|nr:hypothetical protein [Candidatus Accumulibacter phosphatis]TMQ75441.1 hypothetical protein ACCUM_1312 [Candidatus Accumulibacter phosphatis]